MQVSNEAEVTESEIVFNMSAELGSDALKDTSDMVRSGLKDILQKLDLSRMKNWEPFIAESFPRTDKGIRLHFLPSLLSNIPLR